MAFYKELSLSMPVANIRGKSFYRFYHGTIVSKFYHEYFVTKYVPNVKNIKKIIFYEDFAIENHNR